MVANEREWGSETAVGNGKIIFLASVISVVVENEDKKQSTRDGFTTHS